MKVAIYTCVINNYDKLYNVNDFQRDGIKFFCITDSKSDISHGWNTIHIDDYIDDSYCKYSRTNRYYKLHPHLYFKDYDINVYIDGNKRLINIDLLLKYCKEVYNSKEIDMILPAHSDRKKLSEEFYELIHETKKEKIPIMEKQWKEYQEEGYDDSIILTVNSVQIRKTNSLELINFLENWWQEVKNKSYRDQLSFCYVCWKLNYFRYRLIDVWQERMKMIVNETHRTYFDAR